MAQTCKDINGNDINEFVFQNDGVVYGVVNYQGGATNYETTIPYSGGGELVNIPMECCSGMGFTYDSDQGKCFYREVCAVDTQVKIVFNVNEQLGLVFTQEVDEQCALNLKFDYLVDYDSTKLYELFHEHNKNVIDIIKTLKLSVLIEKNVNKDAVDGNYYEINKVLVPILEREIYEVDDLSQDTGIILSGAMVGVVNNKLQNELGSMFSTDILDSNWLSANILIEDQQLISQILDEEVKFSIVVTNTIMDFSIILDNIELNKVCDTTYTERKIIDKSPSFNMERVIDNKKSWINTQVERSYEFPIRETYYNTDSEKMIINSKEIELSTSAVDAIEYDVVQFLKNHLEILTGDGSIEGLWATDLTNQMITQVDSTASVLKLLGAIQTELIDVKSRKSLIGYPLLNMIHERYLESPESNKYDYSKLSDFIGLLGNYWVDLIEQVIPATTLWGSTNRVGTTALRTNKFAYKKYSLLYKYKEGDDKLPTEVDGDGIPFESGVEVIITEVGSTDVYPEKVGDIYIESISDSCEGIGRVIVIGTSGNNTISN